MQGGGGGGRPSNWDHGNWHHPNWNNPGPWNNPGWWFNVDEGRRRGRPGGALGETFPRRNSWEENLAISAIQRFSLSMSREISPWTTTESRNLRGRANEPLLEEARRLVRIGRYYDALQIYREIYERDGNIDVAFNAALMLAATERLAEALGALESLHRGLLAAGQNTPRFVTREIQRLTGFVNGLRILEEQRGISAAVPVPPLPPLAFTAFTGEALVGREVSGTVNINRAQIYALTESIYGAHDTTIWSKMVAAAETGLNAGRWSMSLPDEAPARLWFVVTYGGGLYITPAAVSVAGVVVLDTGEMSRLE